LFNVKIRVYEEEEGLTDRVYDADDAKDSKEVVGGPVDAMTEEEEVTCYADVSEDDVGQFEVDHGSRRQRWV
jgi:hypothetical protein